MKAYSSFLLLSLAALASVPAHAAITFDAVASNSENDSPTGQETLTISTAGNNRYLVGIVHYTTVMGDVVTDADYNGVSLTTIINTCDPNSNFCTHIWGLVAPATGSHTLTFNYTTSNMLGITIAAMSFDGVAQTSSVNAQHGNGGLNDFDATDTITTTVDNAWVITAVNPYENGFALDPVPQSPITGKYDQFNTGMWMGAAGGYVAGVHPAGAQALDWSFAISTIWSMSEIALKPFVSAIRVPDFMPFFTQLLDLILPGYALAEEKAPSQNFQNQISSWNKKHPHPLPSPFTAWENDPKKVDRINRAKEVHEKK